MRRVRQFVGVILVAVVWFGIMPVKGQSVRPPDNAVVQSTPEAVGPSNTLGKNSVSNYWRDLRKGQKGRATDGVRGGQLIQSNGEGWRLIRQNVVLKYAGWVLLAGLAIVALFYLIRGKIRIKSGRSGVLINRFSLGQRSAHWFMAFVFLFLAFTGLYILLGRLLIISFIGKSVHSVLTSAAMQGHNLFGLIFVFALAWIYYRFVPGNLFKFVDLKWLLKGGGFFGGHVSAGRYNFGEKVWFWLVAIGGLLMSISGIIMEFPWLAADLTVLQISNLVHIGGAITLIVGAVGHIYIGSIGMEGALEGMRDGHVDANWAKEHHDIWYAQMTGNQDGADQGVGESLSKSLGDPVITTSRASTSKAGE